MASRQWDYCGPPTRSAATRRGRTSLTYFRAAGDNLKEIVADCHLSDVILRELVLKVHPKLADHLVNQAMTSTPNIDSEERGPGEEEMDDRPRPRLATTEHPIPGSELRPPRPGTNAVNRQDNYCTLSPPGDLVLVLSVGTSTDGRTRRITEMADLNKVFLMGRLTFDPELRRTRGGTAVTKACGWRPPDHGAAATASGAKRPSSST